MISSQYNENSNEYSNPCKCNIKYSQWIIIMM